MNVQVIGQQWAFTYRYPSYGGIETPHLVLPANTLIRLHVTSLDVVHSFWAYGLGVKADANPGVDNVVYVKLKGPRSFQLRCAELCGLWHGYMFDTGQIVTPAAFKTWIAHAGEALRADPEVPAALRALLPARTRRPRRMKLRRLIGFHLGTGLVLGGVCWYLGWFLGHQVSYPSIDYFADIDQNDIAIFFGYLLGTVGFLAGLGFLNYPLARLTGRPASLPPTGGPRRYFGMATDHKVVGLQYLWGIGLFFFIGGLNAMLIRFELLSPNQPGHPGRPVPDRGRAARHDDDGDHVERDPRAVRELLRADHDRRPADGVPAARGAQLLAADGGRRDPHDDDLLRRLPDRVDGLCAASRPGERRDRLLHRLLRARRDLDVPARAEPAS